MSNIVFTPGTVYFLRERDYLTNQVSSYVKIGIVRNEKESETRIKEHQTGNPREIYNFKDVAAPFVEKLETYLHYRFAEYWVTGEWFNLSDDSLELIIEEAERIAADQYKHEPMFERSKELNDIVSNRKVLEESEEHIKVWEDLVDVKTKLDGLKIIEDTYVRQIRAFIGNKEMIEGIAHWIPKKDTTTFDEKAFYADHPQLYSQNFSDKTSRRRTFSVKGKPTPGKKYPGLIIRRDIYEKLPNIGTSEIVKGKVDRNAELEKIHANIIALQPEYAELEWQKEVLENQLKVMIGEYKAIGELCTWDRKDVTDLKFDQSKLKEKNEELYHQYCKVKEGQASLKVYKWRPYQTSVEL